MFGREFILRESQLTLFDICDLLDLNGIFVRCEQDSFVPARTFLPYGPVFHLLYMLCNIKNYALLCLDFSTRWKPNPWPLMQVRLRVFDRRRSDFDRCSITGLGLPVCACLSVTVCTHASVCATERFKKWTTKCADMSAHSTLDASMTFSYCWLSSHACARKPNTQKLINHWITRAARITQLWS